MKSFEIRYQYRASSLDRYSTTVIRARSARAALTEFYSLCEDTGALWAPVSVRELWSTVTKTVYELES